MFTEADRAELNVLCWALVSAIADHQRGCEACQRCPMSDAWLEHKRECWACANGIKVETPAWGRPCPRYFEWLGHIAICPSCSGSCPQVVAAIQVVIDWRDLRVLLTRAEYLRSGQELQDFAARLGFTSAEVTSLQAKWRTEEDDLAEAMTANGKEAA